MIPKIIHYCWISENVNDKLPEKVQECINTWKQYLPDYEIKRWNQYNFDISNSIYAKQALDCKKYAFVSDYIRLSVLYRYGGIYLDTDMKVLKGFNDLLDNKFFVGLETSKMVATCIIGAEKNNILVKELLDVYKNKYFINNNGNLNIIPNTVLMTEVLKKHNIKINNTLQRNKYLTIYPIEYFCPYENNTGELNLTENSYAIHLYNGSWVDEKVFEFNENSRKYYSFLKKGLPKKIAIYFASYMATYKMKGIKGIFFRLYKRILG